MIVNIRLDVTDEQRNALSLRNNPKAPKRLATRPEFTDYVMGQVAKISQPEPKDKFRQSAEAHPGLADVIPTVQIYEDVPLETPRGELAKLLYQLTNAMHSLVNAEMRSVVCAPDKRDGLRSLRLKVQELRYEIADMHDAEAEKENPA